MNEFEGILLTNMQNIAQIIAYLYFSFAFTFSVLFLSTRESINEMKIRTQSFEAVIFHLPH